MANTPAMTGGGDIHSLANAVNLLAEAVENAGKTEAERFKTVDDRMREMKGSIDRLTAEIMGRDGIQGDVLLLKEQVRVIGRTVDSTQLDVSRVQSRMNGFAWKTVAAAGVAALALLGEIVLWLIMRNLQK